MQTSTKASFEGESVREFLKGFRSEATKDSYTKKLRYFLEYVSVGPDEFLAKTRKDPVGPSTLSLTTSKLGGTRSAVRRFRR